jgi:nucleolar protein 16
MKDNSPIFWRLFPLTSSDYRDKSQTLTQNYRRLGLTARLNAPAGGVEKPKGVDAATAAQQMTDSLHITSSAKGSTAKIGAEEVRVERDPETGRILRVIRDEDDDDEEVEIAGRKRKRSNPLGDPLNEVDGSGSNVQNNKTSSADFIKELERRAAEEEEAVKKRKPRQQSAREEEWIEKLVAQHGDNIQAMVRDRKLNRMQQTEGDLRRRIRIWKERHSS